jgi:hypothetical protein
MRQIDGRVAPVLISRWDADNVVIAYGGERFDVTLAALAAIELGKAALAAWTEGLARVKGGEQRDEPPSEEDGIPRVMEVEVGASTVIEGSESGPEVSTGRLLDVRVREIDEDEAERLRALEAEREDTVEEGSEGKS